MEPKPEMEKGVFASVSLALAIIKVLIMLVGGTLQLLIIYFEKFGRDSAKRSLFNRVRKILDCFLVFSLASFSVNFRID